MERERQSMRSYIGLRWGICFEYGIGGECMA